MPILPDPAYQQSAIAGPVNQALIDPATPPPQDQSALDVLAAAARGNVGGALYDRVTTPDPDMPAAPPGWDPLDHVQGFEGYASDLADAQTPAQLEGRKARITRNQQDAEILSKTGFWGKTGEVVFAGIDPSFLASAYVPEIQLAKWAKTAKTLSAVAQGAAAGAVYETEMQGLKEGRTTGDSLYGVGSVALMSGVLGHLLARVPPSKMKPIYDAINEETALARSEAGAAAAARPTTLSEESFTRGGATLSKAMANTPLIGTDLDRIMASGNVSAHTAVQELADVPQMLGKNEAGIATPRSVEAAVSKHDARLADFIDHSAQQWVEYTRRVPKGERLTKRDFYESIAKASRRNDAIGIPEVDSAAKFLRQNIFDPLKDRALKLGLFENPPTNPLADSVKSAEGAPDGGYSVGEGELTDEQRAIFENLGRTGNGSESGAGREKLLPGTARRTSTPTGESVEVFRGSNADLAPGHFADEALGFASEHPSAGTGVWFTASADEASRYGSKVSGHQLEFKKLKTYDAGEFPAFDSIEEARAFKQKLIDEGYDGIHLKNSQVGGADHYVAFSHEQVRPPEARPAPKSEPKVAKVESPKAAPKPLGAESYFRRMYDRDAIRANLADWHQTLFNHFSKSGDAIPPEIHAAVDDVTNKIMHADVGQSNFATKVTVPAAGPLKERTLDIPDAVIEKFLINDPQRVAQAYIRDLAPQVEMAQAFGDVDMKGRLGDISDEFAIQRQKLRDSVKNPAQLNKRLEKLSNEEKETLEAVVRIRDRVLGKAGRLSPDAGEGTRRAVKASRGWRNLVASARLGGTALTGGVMDTAKIAAQYGFMPTITKLAQFAKSQAFRDVSKAQARRVGSAVETALSKRVQVAYDGAITEGWTQTLANSVYKYTGLNHITDFNRTLAATLFEDSVLKAVGRVAEGKELPAFERTRLASLGLGDKELAGIAEQIAQHGGETDGIRVSGSADWTNKPLADIYDAAILKESKIAVQQPGAADRVWWMDKETGKFIGQLKTFSLSAPTRLLSGGLQMAGSGQYAKAARFCGYMMMGGYLTHALRQTIAGKTPTTDPKTATFEAFSESGLGGVLPDLLSPVGRRLGILGESVRYSDRNALSAYGGPALGAANDLYDFAFNRTEGGLSAKDLHMMRRMLPWNQVWWLRREINAVEGEVAEGFDLQGADQASFGERMLRTDALPSTRDGAGIPVQ